VHNVIRRCATVNEEEIGVVDAVSNESLSVIFCFVESDDSRNTEVVENL
jgi:hypothetical protein